MQLSARARLLLQHPLAFGHHVVSGFIAQKGFLLAGAIAYYALLSIIPLALLFLIALSQLYSVTPLYNGIHAYLQEINPALATVIIEQIKSALDHRQLVGFIGFTGLILFSGLAFRVVGNALGIILKPRRTPRKRSFIYSAVLPYIYVISLALSLVLITIVYSTLSAWGLRGWEWLGLAAVGEAINNFSLYVIVFAVEALILASVYTILPDSHVPLRHAMIGGTTAALLWNGVRQGLIWYYGTISEVNIIFGALTSLVIFLLSLEAAAIILLLGAQAIAEYERFPKYYR